MVSEGNSDISRELILRKISEASIVGYYLGITEFPKLIKSPFRKDENPSFYLYSPHQSGDINYVDLSTGDRGGCMKLLMQIFNIDRVSLYKKIQNDLLNFNGNVKISENPVNMNQIIMHSDITLECKVREWRDYDIEYWESYGISLEWLRYCEVYPIEYKMITRGNRTMTFRADKYAYTFVERKEGKITHKFYQPFNKNGYKWQNNHDKSVLGLWTKIPEKGEKVCICSSVKDALCLMANLKIPCICLQGEGYPISNHALSDLKSRFQYVMICLDNDKAGLEDAKKLSDKHNLINVVIPQGSGGKDISDVYKHLNNKESFIELFTRLITDSISEWYNDLPF